MLKNGLVSICQPATGLGWTRLWKECFPPEERPPLEMLLSDFASGKRLLHTSSSSDRLVCFSVIYPFSQFIWLDYLGVDKDYRSQGIGMQHLSQILLMCKTQYHASKGLFLAIDSTVQDGIDSAIAVIRKRRLSFYMKAGAKYVQQGNRIFIPNCVTQKAPMPGELLWFEFSSPVDSNELRSFVSAVYLHNFQFKQDEVDSMILQFQVKV